MLEKINNRLDQAIANLDKESMKELFPLILDDLGYILISLKLQEASLTPGERFESGAALSGKVTKYLAKLGTVYFKHVYGIDIEVINCDDYNLSTAGAGYNGKDGKIYYTDFGAILSKQTDLSFLHTTLHEGRHKIQHDQYETDDLLKFEPHMLRLLKETLLEESLHDNNRQFYQENYDRLLGENDAEIFAKYEIYNFIRKLMNVYLKETNQKENEVDEILMLKANHIDYIFKTILQKENFNINKKVAQELYDAEMISDTYNKDGQQVDRLIMIDKYIKAHPEFQEKYPVLRLLFSGNTPKSYEEIIAEREMYKQNRSKEEQEHIDKMYDEIISLDPILALSQALATNDMYMLKVYLYNHPTILTEYADEIQSLKAKYPVLEQIINEIIPKNTI